MYEYSYGHSSNGAEWTYNIACRFSIESVYCIPFGDHDERLQNKKRTQNLLRYKYCSDKPDL